MTAIASAELISELDAAVSSGSSERRVLLLLRVTHLFLSSAGRHNEQQIGVFDDVLVLLMQHVEVSSLVQLSSTLFGLDPAPRQAVRRLACHEEIAVAAPILVGSRALSDADLVEIARHLGQRHLLAISSRRALSESLTDRLLERGNDDVCRALAKNAGAEFS